jgi:hypothetical protein
MEEENDLEIHLALFHQDFGFIPKMGLSRLCSSVWCTAFFVPEEPGRHWDGNQTPQPHHFTSWTDDDRDRGSRGTSSLGPPYWTYPLDMMARFLCKMCFGCHDYGSESALGRDPEK